MNHDRGSQWSKWDLHVHTPLSFESNFSINEEERAQYDELDELEGVSKPERFDEDMWAKYVAEIESIDHVDCLGVTDYFQYLTKHPRLAVSAA